MVIKLEFDSNDFEDALIDLAKKRGYDALGKLVITVDERVDGRGERTGWDVKASVSARMAPT